jgi:hypothetical protein
VNAINAIRGMSPHNANVSIDMVGISSATDSKIFLTVVVDNFPDFINQSAIYPEPNDAQ